MNFCHISVKIVRLQFILLETNIPICGTLILIQRKNEMQKKILHIFYDLIFEGVNNCFSQNILYVIFSLTHETSKFALNFIKTSINEKALLVNDLLLLFVLFLYLTKLF